MLLPDGFKEMAASLPGLDNAAFLEAMLRAPVTGIRINPSKMSDVAAVGYPDASPVAWNAEGFVLEERPVFTLNPLLHAGAFYVQDPSSMVYGDLITIALDSLPETRRRSPRVLDLCASPGGKTTAMIARMPERGVMVANEYVGQRVGALRENLTKWGYAPTIICNDDSASFASVGEVFDIVAVDAPCSGEGMMRKDADARAQWDVKLTEQCAALQREILSNACKALRPGGILIYSTCTFNLTENEENLAYLVEKEGLSPIDSGLVGKGGILPALAYSYPALRFMPHSTRGEGLFAAILRKPECDAEESSEPGLIYTGHNERKEKKGKKRNADTPYYTRDVLSWLDESGSWILREEGRKIVALTEEIAITLSLLEDKVKTVSRGVQVAELKGKEYVPTTELVLSTRFNPSSLPSSDLDIDTALSYLRGEAIHIDDAPKGYVAVTYKNIPLGIVKNLGQRANNLYPQQWKIRHL